MKAIGLIAGVGAGLALLYVLVVEVDNQVGFLTSRDMRILQRWKVNGHELGALIGSRQGTQKCRGYHQDDLWSTTIECRSQNGSSQAIVLAWEVAHRYSPHRRVPRQEILLCPLTREAALLTPKLMPPGLTPDDFPEKISGTAGYFYSLASARWRDCDPSRIAPRSEWPSCNEWY